MKDLTSRQKSILTYILKSISDSGRFPSFREIGREFRLRSVATVAQHLRALEDKGFLLRQGRKLMPAPGLRRDRGIAVLGHVSAGQPISAIENYDGQLRWDDFARGDVFAVRVQGDSMIEEGILEGDFALVEMTESVRSGEIVVAYLGEDQDVTVKRLHRTSDRIELRPANGRYSPIRVDPADPHFRLAGRVVGIVRKV